MPATLLLYKQRLGRLMLKDNDFHMNFGKFLQKKRREAGFTQNEVALFCGYSTPQFVSNWERGLVLPPISTIKQLVGYYECNVYEVYDFIAEWQMKILKKELLE